MLLILDNEILELTLIYEEDFKEPHSGAYVSFKLQLYWSARFPIVRLHERNTSVS